MKNAIVVEKLTKKYSSVFTLGEINLTIPKGEIIGLIGENGAGKTTLIKSILGLINNNINLDSMLPTMLGCFFGIILAVAIIYPFIFKYGIEKGRIGLFIGSFVIVGVISFIKKATNINISTNIVNFFETYWYIVVPILFTGFLYISYCISKKIYLKKEF